MSPRLKNCGVKNRIIEKNKGKSEKIVFAGSRNQKNISAIDLQ